MRQASPARQGQRARYRVLAAEHLWRHPLCQITMALNRVNERAVVEQYRRQCLTGPFEMRRPLTTGGMAYLTIPVANQVHHRNKRNGERLCRTEFFMSASDAGHDWAERHKDLAREIGVLCPINARPNGEMPIGARCLTTDELMIERAGGGNATMKALGT